MVTDTGAVYAIDGTHKIRWLVWRCYISSVAECPMLVTLKSESAFSFCPSYICTLNHTTKIKKENKPCKACRITRTLF